MTPSKSILILIIIFVWVSVLLTLFGIINLEYSEIIAYSLMLLGISIYYPSYNKNQIKGIFWGSVIFLSGIISFVSGNYELSGTSEIMIPAILLMISFSMLLIFFADTTKKLFMWIGLPVGAVGVFTLFDRGNPVLKSFIYAIISLTRKFWIVLLLAIVTILILKLEKRKGQDK